MARINWSRVFLGGLVAGLVINIGAFLVDGLMLHERWDQEMAALGKSMEVAGAVLVMVLAWGFVLGILTVWLYAAIRAQYGPGPGTAAVAGVMVWMLNVVLPNVFFMLTELFSARVLAVSSLGALVYLTLGAMAGGWVYKPAEEVVAIEPGVSA